MRILPATHRSGRVKTSCGQNMLDLVLIRSVKRSNRGLILIASSHLIAVALEIPKQDPLRSCIGPHSSGTQSGHQTQALPIVDPRGVPPCRRPAIGSIVSCYGKLACVVCGVPKTHNTRYSWQTNPFHLPALGINQLEISSTACGWS